MLFNPETDLCIWEKLTDDTIKRTKNGLGKGFFVKVPIKQEFLNDFSNQELLSLTNLPQNISNFNFLLSQKQFMSIINEGGTVILHSSEWVNKSSGRGEIELLVDDGHEEKSYLYPYWFPFTSYTEVFPKLFPWATFSVDEDYYEDYDIDLWHDECCDYCNEEDKWISYGESFNEFRNTLPSIRGIDKSGEQAEYRLILGLNDLGKSFLKLDDYLSNNQSYINARPDDEF